MRTLGGSVVIFFFLNIVLIVAAVGAAERRPTEPDDNMAGDPDVQRHIGKIVQIYVDAMKALEGSATPEADDALGAEWVASLARETYVLRKKLNDNDIALTRQVRRYLLDKQKDGREEDVVAALILQQAQIGSYSQAEAMLPYLDAKDPDLRTMARDVFCGIAYRNRADGIPSFTREFLPLLHAHRAQLPLSLIEYMYEMSPADAMLCLKAHYEVKADAERKLLWAEHAVSDVTWKQQHGFLKPEQVEPEAAKQIGFCCNHAEWWVRLYAAEIMRQHPAFRVEKLVATLGADSHPLVRKSIAQITAKR